MGASVQKIGGVIINQPTNQTNTVSKSGNASFQKLMSKTMNSNVGTSVNYQRNSKANDVKTGSNASLNSKSTAANNSNTSNSVNTNKKNCDSKVDKNSKNNSVSNSRNSKDCNSKTVSTIAKAANEVKDTIKTELGVTDEQLEKAMSVLGLTTADLFLPENLTKLIMNLTGVQDTMDILTNADLSDGFKQIMNVLNTKLDEMSTNLNMTTEQLQNYIQMNLANQSEVSDYQTQNVQMTGSEDLVNAAVDKQKTADVENYAEETNQNSENLDNLSKTIAEKLQIKSDGKENKNDLMNNQHATHTTEEIKTTITDISSNLSQSIQNSFQEVIMNTTTDTVNGVDVVKQIINSVKVSGNNLVQSMEIQLNPENLGKVNLTVSAKNGVITAEIITQNEQVKKAVESQIATLKENFENQGIKIDAVEVTVQSHAFEGGQNLQGNNSEQEKSSKGTRKHINLEEFEELSDDEIISSDDMIKNENSSVEYSA